MKLRAELSRFFFIFSIGSVISHLVAYVRVNYLQANLLIGQILTSDDKSGVIPVHAYKSETYAFGVHYFSDFAEALLKTQARAPYTSVPNGLTVSNYPPLGQALLFPFSWVPYRTGVLFFLVLMIIAVGSAFWFVLGKYDFISRTMFLLIGVFCTTPVLFFLDRGNYWGFTTGLILWGLISAERGWWRLASILISCAAALKVFPVLLFVWIYRRSGWKITSLGLISGAALTVGSMFLFKGSPAANFLAFFRAQSAVHGDTSGGLTYQHLNNSMLSLIINLKGTSISVLHELGRVFLDNYFTVIAFVLVVSLGTLFWSIPHQTKRFAEITLLITIINFLPPVVFQYALSLYLVPLLYLLIDDSLQHGASAICTFIGLLFVNKVPFAPYLSQQTGTNLVNSSLQIFILITCICVLRQKVFSSATAADGAINEM